VNADKKEGRYSRIEAQLRELLKKDFTAEAQRGKRGRSRKGLNTKARRHKGQIGLK